MKIYVVRHAQTEANKNALIQGQCNTEITPEGLQNAKRMAQSFADKPITRIFASPIKRAQVTAGLIADVCGISHEQIISDPRLMEIDLQPWVFQKIAELDMSDAPSSYKTYKSSPALFRPLSGESLFDVKARVAEAFADILKQCSEDDNIVIVSHSVAIRSLLLTVENKTVDQVWSYQVKPVSVTTLHASQGKVEVLEIGAVYY